MQTVETMKSKSQESINRLVHLAKQQPEQVRTWGVTVGAALTGALALTAVSKGILGVVATLANPPVALSVGALAGGVLGWSFMQKPQSDTQSMAEAVAVDLNQAVA